jgi:hypothetical protein
MMSLNSVSARKKAQSAHNSPRHGGGGALLPISPGLGTVALRRSAAPLGSQGESDDSAAAPTNHDDVDAVTAAIQQASVAVDNGDEAGLAKELFPDVNAKGNKSPSYQEKLEARIANPSRFRPQSRQKLTVQASPGVDRNAHHVTVSDRRRDGGGGGDCGGGDDADAEGGVSTVGGADRGQVSFLSSMSLRIKSLEAANRGLRQALVAKEKDCLRLQHEVEELRSEAASADVSGDVGGIGSRTLLHEEVEELRDENERLEDENAALRREAAEFHAFLQDYGLQWCGDNASTSDGGGGGAGTPAVLSEPGSPAGGSPNAPALSAMLSAASAAAAEPLKVNFDALFVALAKLNRVAAEDNERKVTVVGQTAVFAPEKPVQLTFYSDGFVVGDDETDMARRRNGGFFVFLVGWLVGRLVGWLVVWLHSMLCGLARAYETQRAIVLVLQLLAHSLCLRCHHCHRCRCRCRCCCRCRCRCRCRCLPLPSPPPVPLPRSRTRTHARTHATHLCPRTHHQLTMYHTHAKS